MWFILRSGFSVMAVNFIACLVGDNHSAVTLTPAALSFFCYPINDLLYLVFGRHHPVVLANC